MTRILARDSSGSELKHRTTTTPSKLSMILLKIYEIEASIRTIISLFVRV